MEKWNSCCRDARLFSFPSYFSPGLKWGKAQIKKTKIKKGKNLCTHTRTHTLNPFTFVVAAKVVAPATDSRLCACVGHLFGGASAVAPFFFARPGPMKLLRFLMGVKMTAFCLCWWLWRHSTCCQLPFAQQTRSHTNWQINRHRTRCDMALHTFSE